MAYDDRLIDFSLPKQFQKSKSPNNMDLDFLSVILIYSVCTLVFIRERAFIRFNMVCKKHDNFNECKKHDNFNECKKHDNFNE